MTSGAYARSRHPMALRSSDGDCSRPLLGCSERAPHGSFGDTRSLAAKHTEETNTWQTPARRLERSLPAKHTEETNTWQTPARRLERSLPIGNEGTGVVVQTAASRRHER